MIKINLLPQKRPKRAAGRRTPSEPAAKHVLYGALALAGAGLSVVFLVDRPMRAEVAQLRRDEERLREDIKQKNGELVGYAEMQKAQADSVARKQAIERLQRAKVVPAHVLHELGEVLTSNHKPTMTSQMIRETSDAKTGDPNKRYQQDWDPMRVWLSGFSDTKGSFKLEGGAQSEADVAQLSKRLGASVFFLDVAPARGERVVDTASGASYYKFTITGRLAY